MGQTGWLVERLADWLSWDLLITQTVNEPSTEARLAPGIVYGRIQKAGKLCTVYSIDQLGPNWAKQSAWLHCFLPRKKIWYASFFQLNLKK